MRGRGKRRDLVPHQAMSARSTKRKPGASWGANMLRHPATVPDGPGLLAQVTGSLSDRAVWGSIDRTRMVWKRSGVRIPVALPSSDR
jgi:hypothetical protein